MNKNRTGSPCVGKSWHRTDCARNRGHVIKTEPDGATCKFCFRGLCKAGVANRIHKDRTPSTSPARFRKGRQNACTTSVTVYRQRWTATPKYELTHTLGSCIHERALPHAAPKSKDRPKASAERGKVVRTPRVKKARSAARAWTCYFPHT
jgi:hypothetical protein